ncbi:hypothetical protein SteCoe_7840 [Stentor coeruleus]|uniref:Uncharacterized protein n=1 Tax=Stentor coeruleus TaxID=5963 RepID=A0A1R2CLU9_9CILI|nr:hypothetical protein SteCoe_7840 [Stentor coeruleus]
MGCCTSIKDISAEAFSIKPKLIRARKYKPPGLFTIPEVKLEYEDSRENFDSCVSKESTQDLVEYNLE